MFSGLRWVPRLVSAGSPFLLAGCAALLQSSHQEVTLTTDPDSARYAVNGYHLGFTPGLLTLERDKKYVVTLEKPGYEPHTLVLKAKQDAGWLMNDLYYALAPAAADWKHFEHDIHVTLTKAEGPSDSSTALASASSLAAQGQPAAELWPADSAVTAMRGRVEVTCHTHVGNFSTDRREGTFRFAGGAMVSKSVHGVFHDGEITAKQGASFYVLLPSGEIDRVRVADVHLRGVAVEWSKL